MPIAIRMLADLMFETGSHLTMDDLKHGRATKDDFRLMAELAADAEALPLVFEEPATLNVGSIAPMIRRHARSMEKRGQKLELVVIDYVEAALSDPAAVEARAARRAAQAAHQAHMDALARGQGTEAPGRPNE